jgi:Xaa-Pro aminopeptidase
VTSPSAADRAIKRERLLAVLETEAAPSLLLTSHAAVSWYLDGARTHTSLAGDPVLAVRVDRDGDRVAAFVNEAERLRLEELPDGIPVTTVPWFGALADAFGDAEGMLSETAIAGPLRAARAQLLPAETDRYRSLGADAAAAMTDVLARAGGMRDERAMAAAVGGALLERGIDPVVILVAGESRLALRHPLPTLAPLGSRAMVVVCGRRHGLIANLTRWVGLTAQSSEHADAEARILEVEADLLAATRTGETLSTVLAAGASSYGRHGFGADEWLNHHQGGAAGYNGRDPRAVPGASDLVVAGQAFSWNPSALGAKVEDTVLIGPAGVEVLTRDDRWPVREVRGLRRPTELRV